MIATNWQTVTPHKSKLGEGPVWDDRRQRIIWLDILNGKIHTYTPGKDAYSFSETGQLTGAVALTENDTLLAAMENGFFEINEATGTSTAWGDPESHLPGNRFNDGKCDPKGRFWAGTMQMAETETTGNLYVMDVDRSVYHKLSDIGCSNGLAWNSRHDTMYYIDSPTREVAAFDYDPETAAISNRRVILTIPEGDGFPDGMTIDAEDQLWVALWDGWKVIRVDPDNGSITAQIELPAARITSATFGGPDLTDLYITSARVGLSEEELEKQPLAGSLFVIRNVGVRGVQGVRFGR
ncbi:SMP-30/gluconolactonase/LRE family protein [Ravibacter arvi]|uniref:Regucalcin n=1 Tax=Ravibacter arvi TaxID=2051041 RepID=A0ABP8LV51_9BACT